MLFFFRRPFIKFVIMCHSKQPAKLAMLIVLPLLLCYGVGNACCSTVHENSRDFHALLDFKHGITDPQGALSDWTNNTHFCRWYGVTCSSRPPYRVTELYLSQLGLGGQISSSLGNLTFLKVLFLGNNRFVGTIPPLNNLEYLETLFLANNLLHGVIPEALTNCSSLAFLSLSMNDLTGEIPRNIGLLSKLTGFSLSKNNLSGVIPPAIGNITTLKVVDLSYNRLSGPIPNGFWRLPTLFVLYLTANSLSGRIPQTLPNISPLRNLSLSSNLLESTLPSNIGDAFPNLTDLKLAENSFHGQIPASLGNATGLQFIDLSFNNLTGQLPSIFGRLPELSDLNLENNILETRDNELGEFFHALANCSLLNRLSVADNKLQGVIPGSIGNLSSNLTRLFMGGNNLSGIVPPSIGKYLSLIQLSLDGNGLSGTIGEWIGNLTKLQIIDLQRNLFTGTIPLSIANLSHLISFSLAENKFTGFIPPSLGNLQHILELNLSYNSFQGRIPVEFGNLNQLTKLDLSSNKIGGEIPESLGQCQQLLAIQLDQNVLTGNITTIFCNLHSLNVLNLSHNDLTGPLPACLNGPTVLTELDLSYNNFQGEIPRNGVFDNATIVSLDGNPRLCGGSMGLHMPSCHVVSRRTRIVNYLIKILIPIFGFMSIILLVYFLFLEKKTTRGAHLPQPSFEHFEKVSYNDLAQATQDFSESNMIGRGSYGSVYRGKLKESKMEVAVKVFNLEMRGAERSFLSECEALRSIQHRNLLPIITACSTLDNTGNVFKALVYELMPNGNLDTWLHHRGNKEEGKKFSLSLTQKISIAVNVADALDYLHHDCGRPTVHCDLKPSNILLDDDMNALLGDFGIARLYADPQSTWAGSISSIGLKGTIGYIPPEYGGGGHASTSGDVYSFGIVLLEMLTSKRPTDPMFNDGLDIISFVENSFPDQIFNVIDVHLVEECKNSIQEKKVPENEIYQCLVALLQVALSCTCPLPSERLNMKQVASKMHAIKSLHLGLKDKRLE